MKENKLCNHQFIHITDKGDNMKGIPCLWIFHKCRKCGLQDSTGLLIEEKH